MLDAGPTVEECSARRSIEDDALDVLLQEEVANIIAYPYATKEPLLCAQRVIAKIAELGDKSGFYKTIRELGQKEGEANLEDWVFSEHSLEKGAKALYERTRDVVRWEDVSPVVKDSYRASARDVIYGVMGVPR